MEQGSMQGKIAIVAGGTAVPGTGIVQVLLEQGATVIVPAPDAAGTQRLRGLVAPALLSQLITYPTDFGEYEKAEELIEIIVSEYGHIDLVVAAIDRVDGRSPLFRSDIREWNKALDCNITPAFVIDRLCLPLLGEHGGVLINIANADHMAPGADNPLARLVGYAGIELAKVFAEEARQHRIHYYHLFINNLAPTNDEPMPASQHSLTPIMVGEEVLRIYNQAGQATGQTFCFFTGKPLDPALLNRINAS